MVRGRWHTLILLSFDYAGYVVEEVHGEAILFGKGAQVAVLAGPLSSRQSLLRLAEK